MKTKQQKKIIIQDSFERDIEKNKNRLPAFSKEKLPVTKEFTNKPGNFSALDLDKLNTAYADQDKSQLDALRQQMTPEQIMEGKRIKFFKKYKKEEEEYYEKRKREEEEKKLQEEHTKAEKQRQEEKNLKSRTGEIPKGKVRKNIFGKTNLKANTMLPPEIKPGRGKQ
ncbi:hypothetical protein A3A93_06155 [Candidatus Roizmanbacteria bacterium RIFCSPLOWO2_01_FULL_38_12]|uniref:Uncharacterized protein n=1 Tax=Candidatus Roizmanbacteria bacterium RIFCSPLOWO2_01_FULL_38_12 TaxID=1802061 RepID=A0A1F7IU11_9BACT|nr:MAG: hypothetical protein A3F59_00470 [Candidatus Roizmanbacteria bacterium RIFCSPHIGHO2_12_FULL_38_13]OGK46814.1 MAG: hypothetical protein A3A93_06155 [Candidatus Roizmanbacteria bacterium RIFCSPLOWO2_01_FULL_38_12]